MKLSVVIPCFNEIKTIERVLDSVSATAISDMEIIVVDDCSVDGTRELLTGKLSSRVDHLVLHDRNQGKGAAIRSGLEQITGDIVIIQDADLEYDPRHFPELMAPILADKADVVYGSRFLSGQPHRVLYFWHRVGNNILTLCSNAFTNLDLTDMETGYKAIRSSILKGIELEEDRFGFEPEITAKLAKTNCRIFEIGISYYGRTYAQGKKIGWKDGIRAIYCIVKYNLFR